MGQASRNGKAHKLLYLELLPVLAFTPNFDLTQINAARQINAAVVNISGRQRMLSQRTALYSLHLACSDDRAERESLRSELLAAIDLMEKSHEGLINGDAEMKLPGQLSPTIAAMYFEAPLHLDRQVRNYILQLRNLAGVEDKFLTQDNPYLRYILTANNELLDGLNAVVNQYQQESETEQLELDIYLAKLYEQSCVATATAQAQTQQLEKALQQLQQERAKLIHTERISSLGQLVASLAHEINNPVNFVGGNLTYAGNYVNELIYLLKLYQEEYSQPTDKIKKQIEEIDLDFLIEDLPQVISSMKIGVDRIAQIVQSLRVFSRADEREMKPTNIHEGIDSTLLILQSRLKAKAERPAIEIIKEYGNLPLVVGHACQLNQVFMNLLTNAIDALEELPSSQTSSGQKFVPKIWIRTEMCHPDYIIVRIADNGPGITPETLSQLFDPFFTTKPIGKGTGLGLSIGHQIITEEHGGSLQCISEPGQGTEFRIAIPLAPPVGATNAIPQHGIPSYLS